MATEAAWLNGSNLEKEEINEPEREKKRKDDRKVLTLTGLLMEGLGNERTARAGGSLRALNMVQAAVVLLAGGWNGSS